MFKILSLIIQLTVWINAEPCLTPWGDSGTCIPLSKCAPFVNATSLNKCKDFEVEIVDDLSFVIKEAYCGEDVTREQKVCCGPLPHDFNMSDKTPTTVTQSSINNDVVIDPVMASDSYPESQETCGIDSGADRILLELIDTGTELTEYPWTVMLRYLRTSGELQFGCGGALINRRYVLTAAHCLFDNAILKLATARLGEYNTEKEKDCDSEEECTEPVQEIPVQAYFKHPGYNNENRNRRDDIGLVRLSRRAQYNDYVQPICLADPAHSKYAPGISTIISGWGRTSAQGKHSAVKSKVNLWISNTTDCFAKYREGCGIYLNDKQLCAGLDKGNSCVGDSGGALMRLTSENTWEAIGVTSFGFGCGKNALPLIYTSVASYFDWIQEKMKETNV